MLLPVRQGCDIPTDDGTIETEYKNLLHSFALGGAHRTYVD
jgi:hypothetical protein